MVATVGKESLDSAELGPRTALPANVDFALAGLGLQNILLLLTILRERPEATVAAIDRSRALGGNHTWSFQESDVPPSLRRTLDPLVTARWPAYDVAFPGYSRRIQSSYASITSERAREVLLELELSNPNVHLLAGTTLCDVSKTSVSLDDGAVVRAEFVADARGPERSQNTGPCGYQKFVGVEVELAKDSPRDVPMVMDARVEQTDGYRFMYVLPFTARRVLIEDTYFSDGPELDDDALRAGILQYADAHGYAITRILREEKGVLPLPYGKKDDLQSTGSKLGYAGGWFHPATGYSLPVAIRLANHCVTSGRGSRAWNAFARHHRSQAAFCRRLNKLLFRGYRPGDRRHVFERFYKLDDGTIRRFYALEMVLADRLRILFGGPPRGFSIRRYLQSTK